MRTRIALATVTLVSLLTATLGTAATQDAGKSAGEQYIGIWSGGWEGGGQSGGFTLTVEKGKDAALAGKVSVTGEPTYTAALKSIAFDGGKMSGKYDFTPDPNLEVTLALAFDGTAAKGTWAVRDKGNGNEIATGTLSVAKK
jgi:hypothetical protein